LPPGWYYQFESAGAVGPFKTGIEAGTAARDIMVVVNAWNLHKQVEPDISTERLFAMIETDTGVGVDRQIEALQRAGILEGGQS
jgi:hypothetical protein